ncbi:hypothetical protein BBJ28_00018166, partial [Nothophytophthora sp. Chile5]
DNQLSAIRTCYEKPTNISSEGPTTQIDCANATATTTFSVCSADSPITLIAYTAPDASTPEPTATATVAPTSAPTTAAPTSAPTTAAPTSAPTTAAPTPAPTQSTPRTQPFCELFNQKGFCGLLWFCEWSSSERQCNGRGY